MKRIIAIATVLLILIGCATTKDKSTIKHTNAISRDSLITIIEDSIKKVYEEKYKEVGFYIDFYSRNKDEADEAIGQMQDALFDSSVAADSLRRMIRDFKCPESKVKYNTDGSVEVTGKIKSLSGKILELQKSLDVERKRVEKKSDIKIKEYTRTITNTKLKKVRPLWWIYFVLPIVFYVLGWKFPPSKLLPAVKKIFKWV